MTKPQSSTAKAAHMTKSAPQFWLGVITFILILTMACFAFAKDTAKVDPLVNAKWLHGNMANPNIRLIDIQPPAGFQRIHLPGAVNTQYGAWRQRKPVQGKALPDIDYLEKMLGSMGISQDNHIILTPIGANASEIAVATRIYWTLKVLGHKDVSILDGGLIAYSKLEKPHFTNEIAAPTPTTYKATPNLHMAPQASDVLKAMKAGVSFVDYRSEPEFYGKTGGPRPGTIPGSKNLPFDLVVEPKQGGRFLPVDKIKALYSARGIPTDQPEIAFCNSGHRASLSWFVAYELLGNKNARLYDGSMAEWTQYPDYPVVIPK